MLCVRSYFGILWDRRQTRSNHASQVDYENYENSLLGCDLACIVCRWSQMSKERAPQELHLVLDSSHLNFKREQYKLDLFNRKMRSLLSKPNLIVFADGLNWIEKRLIRNNPYLWTNHILLEIKIAKITQAGGGGELEN